VTARTDAAQAASAECRDDGAIVDRVAAGVVVGLRDEPGPSHHPVVEQDRLLVVVGVVHPGEFTKSTPCGELSPLSNTANASSSGRVVGVAVCTVLTCVQSFCVGPLVEVPRAPTDMSLGAPANSTKTTLSQSSDPGGMTATRTPVMPPGLSG
jgi:hypothetical protein